MSVSKRLRYEILRRDNHTCRYCGAQAPDVPLTVDHVVPVALGGPDEASNLVAACKDCNAGKSSTNPGAPLVDDVSMRALAWSSAMAQAAEERRAQYEHHADLQRVFLDRWMSWTYGDGQTIPIPDAWPSTVTTFVTAGLTIDDLCELVDVAMGVRARDTWQYFCGCGWRRVREAQARAAEILGADDGA